MSPNYLNERKSDKKKRKKKEVRKRREKMWTRESWITQKLGKKFISSEEIQQKMEEGKSTEKDVN